MMCLLRNCSPVIEVNGGDRRACTEPAAGGVVSGVVSGRHIPQPPAAATQSVEQIELDPEFMAQPV